MSAIGARHTGLPFVPPPATHELLGSWLLRVAQLYGLGLTTLLSRLGARPAGVAQLPHWFSIDGSTVDLDVLSAATRLSRVDLAAMTPPICRPRWPEELGACAPCLAAAAEAARPITWSRTWMNPLAIVCRIHGIWLTPVATRMLAGVRHAGDFGGVVQHVATAQALLDEGPACVGGALWLQDRCAERTDVQLPWGTTRPHDLIRIVDAVAREVMSASEHNDNALGALGAVKDFDFEISAAQRVVMSLPTRLRQRQWVLGRVANVLRLAPGVRNLHWSWSAASIKRLASMRNLPDGALAWFCPTAAALVRRQDELREEFSISPRYFKACAALLATIE
jgi:hypothetical protein